MNWLEVSLTVDGEMAEAVSEVLARYIPSGLVIESTAIAPDLQGEGYPVGPLRVCGYLPVDERVTAGWRCAKGRWTTSPQGSSSATLRMGETGDRGVCDADGRSVTGRRAQGRELGEGLRRRVEHPLVRGQAPVIESSVAHIRHDAVGGVDGPQPGRAAEDHQPVERAGELVQRLSAHAQPARRHAFTTSYASL